MWAGVVLYATVGWRVWTRRKEPPVAWADDPPPPRPFEPGHAGNAGVPPGRALATKAS
jgi:hypothetical protein